MYRNSPGYLKTDGKYLNIAQGPPGFISQFKFNHWPVILGGTPRTFTNIFSPPSVSAAKEVVSWFKQGWIKEAPIDSVFEMDDAQQVKYYEERTELLILIAPIKAFEKLISRRAAGKIVVKVK